MPAEKLKRRPFTVPSEMRRSRPSASAAPTARAAAAGIARKPERTRQDARAAAGQEPERQRAVGAVQRLVVGAVAGEHDDRVDGVGRRCGGELGRVARVAA